MALFNHKYLSVLHFHRCYNYWWFNSRKENIFWPSKRQILCQLLMFQKWKEHEKKSPATDWRPSQTYRRNEDKTRWRLLQQDMMSVMWKPCCVYNCLQKSLLITSSVFLFFPFAHRTLLKDYIAYFKAIWTHNDHVFFNGKYDIIYLPR